VPFIPFVLLLAWQAISKSASFALGWATASFFGQIPGNRGRILSIMGLISVAWVIAGVGAFIPLALGIAAQETGVIGAQSVEIEVWHLVAIAASLILAPPVVTAFAEFGFEREGSIGRWLRRIPLSYPVTASLGISVLQMVVITPIVSLRRWRRHHTTLNIPLVVHDDHFDQLTDALSEVLATLGHEAHREELTGPVSWPSRTMGLAVRELLGSVVRGDPVRIRGGEIELALHATNVSVVGPKEDAHTVRSAIEKELAFSPAFLTWSEPSQEFEAQLKELYDASDGSVAELTRRLDELQEKIDAADLKLEEWNVLYRLRLQIERDVRKGADGARADDSRPERVAVAAGR
jgi:hypothetical protein